MTKLLNSYDLEKQIIGYIYQSRKEIKLIDKKQLKNPYGYRDIYVFQLKDIAITLKVSGGRSGKKHTIFVEGAKFTSLYADNYLLQILNNVLESDIEKPLTHPTKIIELQNILKKIEGR